MTARLIAWFFSGLHYAAVTTAWMWDRKGKR